MVERLAPGEAAARAFGSVLALRAMAEAAEGLEDDARFHWSLAVHLRPDLVHANLARYGEGGRVLTSWVLEKADEEPVQPASPEETTADGQPLPPPAQVDAPRKIPPLAQPQYPAGARAEGIQGVVILQAVIDRTGKVTDIKVLKGLHPGLDYRAAEAVRTWRFEPARVDGEPVDVYYNLTTSFTLRDGPDLDREQVIGN